MTHKHKHTHIIYYENTTKTKRRYEMVAHTWLKITAHTLLPWHFAPIQDRGHTHTRIYALTAPLCTENNFVLVVTHISFFLMLCFVFSPLLPESTILFLLFYFFAILPIIPNVYAYRDIYFAWIGRENKFIYFVRYIITLCVRPPPLFFSNWCHTQYCMPTTGLMYKFTYIYTHI